MTDGALTQQDGCEDVVITPSRLEGARRVGVREARTFAKASVSSGIATLVDGGIYQAVLFFVPSYTLAAFAGAVLGAVTNFALNRTWAFPRTSKGLAHQAMLYAIASGATYLALQLSLFLLIEVAGVHTRVAWLPAKAAAWLLVSYPMQRFFVFAERRRSSLAG